MVRERWRPEKRWMDCVNSDMKEKGVIERHVTGQNGRNRVGPHPNKTDLYNKTQRFLIFLVCCEK